eukprot:9255734-Alexandrium_andersonii.AAC.1
MSANASMWQGAPSERTGHHIIRQSAGALVIFDMASFEKRPGQAHTTLGYQQSLVAFVKDIGPVAFVAWT